MSSPRPTFSEFWHRVQTLRPRLRGHVRAHRQRHRGQPAWVLHDPATDKFVRVPESVWRVIGLLDGRRTVGEVWEARLAEGNDDHAPTQGETLQALGQLYQAGMLQAEVPPDVRALFERTRRTRAQEWKERLLNPVFLRLPLVNPDRLLDALVRPLGWLFSPLGLGLWTAWMLLTLWHGLGAWGRLWDAVWGSHDSPGVIQMLREGQLGARDLWLMYALMVVLKLAHELGHGLCCKRMAMVEGRPAAVNEAGVQSMMLVPAPFIDTTASWTFASRLRRAWVGMAGMYMELILGAVAVWVWLSVSPGSLTGRAALQVILLVAASVLLFNANPLVRFDGYHILSDLLGIPNLAQRAKAECQYVLKKYAFGVRQARSMALHAGERPWLLAYGVSSFVYSTFLGFSIFWVLSGKYLILGLVLACVGLWTGMIWPVLKGLWYLFTSPELDRNRPRALGVTGVTAALLLGLAGLLPLPDRIRQEGVVHLKTCEIFTRQSGWIESVQPTGTWVKAGQPIARLTDPDLLAEHDKTRAMLAESALRVPQLEQKGELGTAAAEHERLAAISQRLADLEQRVKALELIAPQDGYWHAPQLEGVDGFWLEAGHAAGAVVDPSVADVRVALTQDADARVRAEAGASVELRLRDQPACGEQGQLTHRGAEADKAFISPNLSESAGGSIPQSQVDGHRPARRVGEVVVKLATAGDLPRLEGTPVEARFSLGRTPLFRQGWRWLLRQIQRRDRT